MIEFSKIDKDFTIYKKNKVILFGASSAGVEVKQILESNGIEIYAFVDNDSNKEGKKIKGIEIVSFKTLCMMLKRDTSYIIQISSMYENEIAEQLKEVGANYIWYSEFCLRMTQLAKYRLTQKGLRTYFYNSFWKRLNQRAVNVEGHLISHEYKKQKLNFMISAPKVGNTTMAASCGNNIGIICHTYSFMDEELANIIKNREVNLVVGVRDVISQNLSTLFQLCDVNENYYDIEEFWQGGGDVQEIFDKHVIHNRPEVQCWYEFAKKRIGYNYLVQDFFDQEFKKFWGIDIYQYPFDKEKGYSIYKINNVNILIYQLEKMNALEKEIGEFLDIEDFKLIHPLS